VVFSSQAQQVVMHAFMEHFAVIPKKLVKLVPVLHYKDLH
jgi:hypothetical protein